VDLKVSNPTAGGVNASAALVLRNFPGGRFEGMSAVDETNLLTPDLVSLWIGNNDVLGAALAGVAQEGVTLTPLASFTAKYNEVMTGLRATGRTLVVLNVPDVAAIPFTTTVPPVVVNPATRQPVLVGGQPVPLLGSRTSATCPTAPCPIPADTLVTIQAIPLLTAGIGIPTALGGTGLPLPDGSFTSPTLNAGVLLYADEVAAIRTRTNEINAAIASAANSAGAILLDIHAFFEDIKAHGYEVPGLGLTLTPAFLSGGIFSADGFHPNNIAHAIIADEIIQALNEARDLSIERPNLADAFFTADLPVLTPLTLGQPPTPADTWRGLLRIFPPVEEGIEVLLPSLESRPAPVLVRRKRGRG
jgi:lysophospholipase L1-like esterase